MTEFTLETLAKIVAERRVAGDSGSYTAALAAKGSAHCARKFGEEAVEAVVAGATGDKASLTVEAADVLYHLLVLLEVSGVAYADVVAELSRRTAQSGLEEKAGRGRGA
jgi:phosphoribosyl-ATP pyrophosphohydrolase